MRKVAVIYQLELCCIMVLFSFSLYPFYPFYPPPHKLAESRDCKLQTEHTEWSVLYLSAQICSCSTCNTYTQYWYLFTRMDNTGTNKHKYSWKLATCSSLNCNANVWHPHKPWGVIGAFRASKGIPMLYYAMWIIDLY